MSSIIWLRSTLESFGVIPETEGYFTEDLQNASPLFFLAFETPTVIEEVSPDDCKRD